MSDASPNPEPPVAAVWSSAKALLAKLLGRWAWPDCVAEQQRLTAQERWEILSLLRPLEAFARLLLQLHGLQLHGAQLHGATSPRPQMEPAPRPAQRAPSPRIGVGALCEPAALPEDSAAWPVAFRLAPRRRSYVAWRERASSFAAQAASATHPDGVPAAPLARRIEAVIRVIEDPAAYAARLCSGGFRGPRPADAPTPIAQETRAWLQVRAAEIGVAEAEAVLAALADTS